MSASNPKPPRATPAWKWLLALLSLVLSSLLWVNGLLESLERPSVGNALTLRQMELAVQAAPALPNQLRVLLAGEAPVKSLITALTQQIEASQAPPEPALVLELALLELQAGDSTKARQRLDQLQGQVPPEQRPLLGQLASPTNSSSGSSSPGDPPNGWSLTSFQQQLLCGQLWGQAACPEGPGRNALLRLIGVSAAPVVLLLVGLFLLAREGWRRWRGQIPAPPALRGPPLDPVDATLLIAGGFVVGGELLIPLLLAPLLRGGLAGLAATGGQPSALQQAITVLVMYAGLMSLPLLILWAQLQGKGPRPQAGWLAWGWRPLASAGQRALAQLLMVLPLVTAVGWLMEHVVGNNSGSNPLLELVLSAEQPLALILLAFTATVLAPLFEETLFRGVLLPVVGQRYGGAMGVLISAAVFGLAHLSLGELPALFVLGLGLGWLRLQSGRLAPSVLMHGLWNGLTFANLLLLAH